MLCRLALMVQAAVLDGQFLDLSERAAVVSFRDDYIKWERIEAGWWVTTD